MRQTNRFKRGSGNFNCENCTRSTRDTGDNGNLKLCPECYEAAGIENEISDNGWTEELAQQLNALELACIEKGGKIKVTPMENPKAKAKTTKELSMTTDEAFQALEQYLKNPGDYVTIHKKVFTVMVEALRPLRK